MPHGVKLITEVITRAVKSNCFGQCLKNVSILSAKDGQCKAEFTIANEHLNLGGTLHGGFTATLVDAISTFALITHATGAPGVSVDMNISYMKAGLPGDIISIDARTIRAGRNIAFLEVELAKKDSGIVIARGQHTKFIGT